jgi:peptidoglycan/LPS O-acetylase OafA/YrhL
MQYRPEIDGLRSIAVLPVLLFHAGFQTFSGGFVGVDIFFVISGYLITSIILKEKLEDNFQLVNFYERRARRILPALFLIMFFCIPFAFAFMTPSELKDFALSLGATSLFGSNILFWQDAGYFAGPNELKPLLHTWSLAVEEQYYIIFPLFLMLTWNLGFKWILSILSILALFSLILSQWASLNAPVANFYLLPTRGWELLMGVFTAFYILKKNYDFAFAPIWMAEIGATLGVLLIGYSIVTFDSFTPFPGIWTLVPTIGTVLIILFASPRTVLGRLLSLKLIVGIGLISYSLYLWHQPLFAFARIMSHDDLNPSEYFALIALSFIFAFISWKYIEKIFRDKNRIKTKNIFLGSALMSMLLLVMGSVIYFKTPLFVNQDIYNRSVQLESLQEGRKQNIQSGICHYNGSGRFTSADEFIQNWSCYNDDEKEMISLNLGIYGDSHSSDVAMSLRMNGFDFIQIGGANCKLLDELGTQPLYCKDAMATFNNALKSKGIDAVMLANNFAHSELTLINLQNIFDYWSQKHRQVYILSPIPESIELHREFLKFGMVNSTLSFKKNKLFYKLLKSVTLPDNIIILDSAEFLCSNSQGNCFFVDSIPRMVDEGHLSIYGAQEFGQALAKTESFNKLIQ